TVRRAVLDALRGRPTGLEREELIKQARGLLGYDRTGPRLKAAISSAIDALLASGALGESSTGIRLREVSSAPGDPRSDATDT
ncbi:MAG TPA: hypothetical protein VHU81_08245, partial [Thermoanaerobaculia bacterium]|nr:hypothetical protein [Thermoanaerobaculia bacterium]